MYENLVEIGNHTAYKKEMDSVNSPINYQEKNIELTNAFQKVLGEFYPHLDNTLRKNSSKFKYVSFATESIWLAFELGYKARIKPYR